MSHRAAQAGAKMRSKSSLKTLSARLRGKLHLRGRGCRRRIRPSISVLGLRRSAGLPGPRGVGLLSGRGPWALLVGVSLAGEHRQAPGRRAQWLRFPGSRASVQ